MIAVGDRRDGWVGLSSRPERLEASPGWRAQNPSTRAKWRSSPSARWSLLQNCLTVPTLLEMRFNAKLRTFSTQSLVKAGLLLCGKRNLSHTAATTAQTIDKSGAERIKWGGFSPRCVLGGIPHGVQ